MSRSLSQRTSVAADKETTSVTPAGTTDPQSTHEDAQEEEECGSEADKRFWWFVTGVSGALVIATGSFGAHGLKKRVSSTYYLDVWQTAAHYHLTHTLALGLAPIIVAGLRKQRARTGMTVWQQVRHTVGLGSKGAVRMARSSAGPVKLRPYRNWAATLLTTGGVIFCGSLYTLVLTESGRPWGMVAPVGGFAIIAGWLLLAVGL